MHASHSRFADVYVTLYVAHLQGTLSDPFCSRLTEKLGKLLLNSKTKKSVNLKTFWTTYLFIHSFIYLFIYLFIHLFSIS